MKIIQNFFLVLFMLFNSNLALSDIKHDANILFNWAEVQFPELLTPPTNTQYFDEWCFRHYPPSDTYVGVVCEDVGEELLKTGGEGFLFQHVYGLIGTEFFEYGHINDLLSLFCVNIPLDAREGIIETLDFASDGELFMQQKTEFQTITNTTTISEVNIKRFSPQSEIEFESVSTETESYDIKNDFIWHSGAVSKTEMTETFAGTTITQLITEESTFTPAFQAHPVNKICTGQTWTANAYTESTKTTLTVQGNTINTGSDSIHQPGYKGIVTSIHESVTVQAGTFDTVRMDFDIEDGSERTNWISSDIGAIVKIIISGTANGQPVAITAELVDLQQ